MWGSWHHVPPLTPLWNRWSWIPQWKPNWSIYTLAHALTHTLLQNSFCLVMCLDNNRKATRSCLVIHALRRHQHVIRPIISMPFRLFIGLFPQLRGARRLESPARELCDRVFAKEMNEPSCFWFTVDQAFKSIKHGIMSEGKSRKLKYIYWKCSSENTETTQTLNVKQFK